MAAWTPADVEALRHALSRAADLRSGLAAASAAIGRTVTRDAADMVLRRHKMGTAASLVGTVPRQPPVHIVDDEPTIPSMRAPQVDDIPVHLEEPEPPPLGWRYTDATERILFVPDTHVPYHDRAAWGVMMQCARRVKPTQVVILGDFLDFYQASDHEKNPQRCTSIRHDVDMANALLDELDALGASVKLYIEGNHERRLTRYLTTRAPALLDSIRLPDLLRLGDRGWSWTPYHQHARVGDVWVTHDTGHAGAWAHQRSGADFMGSTVIGHTHRLATVAFGNSLGQRFQSCMFGWLGSVPDADYLPAAKRMRDWSHGFGLGWQVGEHVHLQAVPIVGYEAVIGGEVVGIERAA